MELLSRLRDRRLGKGERSIVVSRVLERFRVSRWEIGEDTEKDERLLLPIVGGQWNSVYSKQSVTLTEVQMSQSS